MRRCLMFLLLLSTGATASPQAEPQQPSQLSQTLSTTSTGPYRFLAVHGQHALVMGYAATGLEVWAYPYQLVDHYRIRFLTDGGTHAYDGASLLTRVEYSASEVVRTYAGPGFTIRERIFVPIDQPGAILSYEVEGRIEPDIEVTCLPVMNLMWPGAVGGQEVSWRDSLHGYVFAESTLGYTATLASPQISAHRAIVNSTLRQDLSQTFVLHPASAPNGLRRAEVYFALDGKGDADAADAVQQLQRDEATLRKQAQLHYAANLGHALEIETPDVELNSALHWAEVDLYQSVVCHPTLLCGFVAGYGPSRGTRRPQYDWFFAGDGLVATDALLSIGDYEHALHELTFILRFQNPSNGMIWHEISQSAGFIDWAKYPYMYVHVDITFAYLAELDRYVAATGDTAFVRAHWPALRAAFAYCRSVIDPGTGLPFIPADKEGGDEQDRPRDDIGLSASWIAATAAWQHLATAAGDASEAAAATTLHDRAAAAFRQRYWSTADRFWVGGYTASGTPIDDQRSRPAEVLSDHLFTPYETTTILRRLSSAEFQTDWGTRSMATHAAGYDPDSYSKGSVSALATASLATAFWHEHQPAIAWQVWQSLLPWSHLDSLGHMHEVLAGDLYHPQVESVPEQTWSSAGLLSAAIHGLFGITIDPASHHLTLAPHHLPFSDAGAGGPITLRNLHAGSSLVDAELTQRPGEIDLTLINNGDPLTVTFAPQIPLGASHPRAELAAKPLAVQLEAHDQDQHAHVEFPLPHGVTRCRILYSGGLWIEPPRSHPQPGAPSTNLRLHLVRLNARTLTLAADLVSEQSSSLILETPWKPARTHGATLTPDGQGRYRLTFDAPAQPASSLHPVSAEASVSFEP